MKKHMMNGKNAKLATSIFLLVILVSTICACGNNKLVGEYNGTYGSYLKINKDGTCIYAEDDWGSAGTGTGKWYVKDNVIYVETDNLNYTIFAEIKSGDDGLLFKAQSYYWRAEYFSKK